MVNEKYIHVDQIVREVVDELYEKDKMVDSKEDIVMTTLAHFYVNSKIAEPVEGEKTYSIKEFIDKYLSGKKKKDYYYSYKGEHKSLEFADQKFDAELDYDTIHNQIHKTWRTFVGKGFKPKEIPESSVQNVLSMLKFFHHPLVKNIRINRYTNLKPEHYANFVESFKEDQKNKESLNEYSLDYKLETTLNFELYKEIAKAKKDIDDLILSDLVQLRFFNDPVRRLEYVRLFRDSMISSIKQWQIGTKNRMDLQQLVLNHFEDELIDETIRNEEKSHWSKEEVVEKISPELEAELEERFKSENFTTGYQLNKDFLAEDFKLLMKALEEDDARVNKSIKDNEEVANKVLQDIDDLE